MSDSMGPLEKAVRDTLPSRPAACLYADRNMRLNYCFSGLFNGARSEGWLRPDGGLTLGKAECEWDWREVWGELRKLGLVEWRLEERVALGAVGGKATYFFWSLTDKGRQVRDDDDRYSYEMVDAIIQDRDGRLA